MTPTETEIIEIVERIEVPRVVLHPNLDLPDTDGGALESAWQRDAMCLLIELVRWFWYGRTDFYVGGNMFIYFTTQQEKTGGFRGPDFFLVKNVDGTRKRRFWHLIVEDGRYPDLIIELLSPSTAENDLTVKKRVYEQTFRTPEYFCYDPATMKLHGWRLERGHYQPIAADARGWMWSETLNLWLGSWEGEYQGVPDTWLRFYDANGHLVPTPIEAAKAELARLKEPKSE